ncbi:hypothetical protein Tco_0448656 [Tanacetum coccineum]
MMVIPTHHEAPSSTAANTLFPLPPSATLDVTLHPFPSSDVRCPRRNILHSFKIHLALKCNDLSDKLNSTQNNLDQTTKALFIAQEELKRCRCEIQERDFIISEQKKTAREDKLSVGNKIVVS